MMHTNFTPGPSQLYFTASDHARQAFKQGIPSISHRSKEFEKIFQETTDGLRQLLGVPADFHVFFTGSATEIWERIIQNLVEKKCLHLVNGSFSKRFHEMAIQSQRHAEKIEAAEGTGFTEHILASDTNELIAVTHNETSTGVSLPMSFITAVRKNNPGQLIVIDAVSSLPYPSFDFTEIDSIFFSVQKGFGLPAGLGVWIVNEKCIAKAESLASKGLSIGTYHNLPTLLTNARKNQTPETPNVLGIYLLNKIVHDFLRKGLDVIRKETEYKAALLYHTLEQHSVLAPFVTEKQFQSKTVIVANTGQHTEKLTALLISKGLHPGDGYGANRKTQLRFANFPAHSKEQYEHLADTLQAYQG
jgi:phosphoserine aminotransferase